MLTLCVCRLHIEFRISYLTTNSGSQIRRASMASVTRRKVVIDVDIGSDDAIAVMICSAAEKHGLINILGITCVNGNTSLDNVCRNTVKTLKVINRLDIPIFRGAASPLSRKTVVRSSNIHGTDGFGDFDDLNIQSEDVIQKEHAVSALIRIVNEHPGEVTLLCLAPLTNVALAMKMDPTFTDKVKEIYIMGGNMEGIGNVSIAAEFNFFCDPESAYVVLEEAKCPLVVFPWEAAFKYGEIPFAWRRDVLGSIATPEVDLMNKVEKPYFESGIYTTWSRCDPQAAAAFISPSFILEAKQFYATVELQGQHTRGQMVLDHPKKSGRSENVTVIKRIDLEKYKQLLLWAVGGSKDCPL